MNKTSLLPSFEATPLHGVDLTAQTRFTEIATELEVIKDLTNPDKCKAEYLPFLAFAYNVDFWDVSLSEKEKRNLIKASFLLHQKKGTIWAIEKVFETLNIKATIKEWFDYNGLPYHFKVDLSLQDKEITLEETQRLTKYLNIYKNVRSVLDELILSYLNKYNLNTTSGSSGEAKSSTQMIDYEEKEHCLFNSSLNNAGEVSSKTKMNNYEEKMTKIDFIYTGAMAEITCYCHQI